LYKNDQLSAKKRDLE